MQNKKGLSDVVTTVIIVALSLVAIGIVWVVINNLISDNTASISSSGDCLMTNLEIVSASLDGTTLSAVVKRIGGDSEISGVRVYAYNSTSTVVKDIIGNFVVGEQKSTTLTIVNPTKVSVTPYFVIDNKESYCPNAIEKDL